MTRVIAPSRLHFGLFHVPVEGLTHYPDGRPMRKFGGLGLMIDQPSVTVTVKRSGSDSATGNLFDRALQFIDQLRERGATFPFHEFHATGPAEHTGFGIGTALGMAIASIVHPHYWLEKRHDFALFLASLIRRGRRSGIGVHGFERGGFLVDDGKIADHELPELGSRLDFPKNWRIILVKAPILPIWHGEREHAVFNRNRSKEQAILLTDRLRALAYNTIAPAVQFGNYDTFVQSISEFNLLAGEPFHHDQGGSYACPAVMCVIDDLIKMGAIGVGQSSWGPTVFAFARDLGEANHLSQQARDRFPSSTEVTVTEANNVGARSMSSDESLNHADEEHIRGQHQ